MFGRKDKKRKGRGQPGEAAAGEDTSTVPADAATAPATPGPAESVEVSRTADARAAADAATPEEAAGGGGTRRRRGFFSRLREKLNSGNSWLTYDLGNLLPGRRIDDEVLEELETSLIMADVGVPVTERIMGGLNKRVARAELDDYDALAGALREEITALLTPVAQPLAIPDDVRPFVILMVGVNGAGKTTTAGKLARRFAGEGKRVMLAAGDTFRAAAVEQLQIWGERNGIDVIAQFGGADPAAVVFDAMNAARARGIDVLIADTAGRLHTQGGLMDELAKVKRVVGRADATAPHEVMLVLDGGMGQNAVHQARAFHQAIGVTGITVTKLDGTARGGTILAIAGELELPIRFIGVGEGLEDLGPFDAQEFAHALLDSNRDHREALASG